MDELNIEVKKFYDHSYVESGFDAQRRYPNEELCRFMGRNFFHIPFEERKKIKILETGCGSGANLWMVAKENFDVYGIDLSHHAINLAEKMLHRYGVNAELFVQNMCELNFPSNYFDAVYDIFSSYCLNKEQGQTYLTNVNKILRPGALFFSYFPSKTSDAFIYNDGVDFVDSDTLSGIKRKDSPYCGNNYPFRFMHIHEYERILVAAGFQIKYSEIVTRTYNRRQESFSFLVVEAKKI